MRNDDDLENEETCELEVEHNLPKSETIMDWLWDWILEDLLTSDEEDEEDGDDGE